jgi:hypothetical protein
MKVNLNSLSGSYWNKQSLIPICLGLLIGGTGLGTGKAQSNPQSARRPVDASEFKISAISLGMTHEQLLKAHPESVQEDCEEYRDLTDPRNEYLQHYGTIGWGTCTFGLNLTRAC